MSDYIKREDAITLFEDYRTAIANGIDAHERAMEVLKNIPSADVVERKRRDWFHYEGMLICSECHTEIYDDIMEYLGDDVPKFCPDCGADMRAVMPELKCGNCKHMGDERWCADCYNYSLWEQTEPKKPKECESCDKHICVGCDHQTEKEEWRKAQTESKTHDLRTETHECVKPNDDECKGCIYDSDKNIMACVSCKEQTEQNPYQAFAAILFDKDTQEQFIKECEALLGKKPMNR